MEALGLAVEPRNIRHFLALQFVEKREALGADPRNHCKFKTGYALQVLDSEEAGVRQSPGASERQPSALPALEARQYSSNEDGLDLPDKCPHGCGCRCYSAHRAAFTILALGAHISRMILEMRGGAAGGIEIA